MSLLIVGTVAFDSIDTPFGKTDKIIGGAATYISLAASHFTEKISLVSVVGEDFPSEFIHHLNSCKINTDGLQIREGEKSFFWSGKYHNDMNTRDTLVTELNVLKDFRPVVPDNFKHPDTLMLGNLTPAVQLEALRQMRTSPKLIGLDTMDFWMNTAMDELKEALALINVLLINDEEARQLSGEYSLIKASKKILEMGPSYLVIKKGEHGALLFDKAGHIFFAPALPLEDVFDPTGAGDTFAGGFMGYLDATGDYSFNNMKRAIIYGSALASFCVEKFGTKRLINLKEQEINERVEQFVNLVQFDIALKDHSY